MKAERTRIDALGASRYIWTASTPLTPNNKMELAELIRPSLLSPGDLFGSDDLNGPLRKFPDIEQAHPKLWQQSTVVMKSVMTQAVEEALHRRGPTPDALGSVLPSTTDAKHGEPNQVPRDIVFVIKSSPIDDQFILLAWPQVGGRRLSGLRGYPFTAARRSVAARAKS